MGSEMCIRDSVQDVLRWKPKGNYDMVIAGPPCQPFSTANVKRRGKDHPLFPTFPKFFDVLLELKPKAFLLENVKGLLTRRHKSLFEVQLRRVEPCYRVRYRVINAAYYGVPQRRERLFVLGIRRDVGVMPSFPPPTHAEEERMTLMGKLHKWVTVKEAIGDLLSIPPANPRKLVYSPEQVKRVLRFRRGKLDDLDEPSRVIKVDGRGGDKTNDAILVPLLTPRQVERIRRERLDTTRHFGRMEFPDSLDKPSRTVSSHTVEGTKRETIVVPVTEHVMTAKGGWDSPKSDWGSRVIPENKPGYTITEKHRSGQLVEVPSLAWLKKHPLVEPDVPSNAIVSNIGKNKKWLHNAIMDGCRYRRLTVRECLRLMGFPDWWGFPGHVSTSRKYKLVGEAVCPILAYRLAVHVGELMGWRTRGSPRREEWDLPYFERAFANRLE